jgi:hypothetical protein
VTGVSYDDLVAAATVGLSHRPLPLTELSGVVAGHAGALDAGNQASALLDAAALMVAARRAGAPPALGVACPAPAPVDQAPELSRRAAGVLKQARVVDPLLLADLLAAAARSGYRAPAPLLPWLLDAAVKDAALRPAVAAVLGARGRWLAGHRPDWQRVSDTIFSYGTVFSGVAESDATTPAAEASSAAGPAATVWEIGRRSERRAYLRSLRDRDPAAARDLLAAGWSRETGEDRADLLTVLADGLSAADEEFLEAALEDRKAAVRAAARRLLTRLPDSAFTRRAAARAAPLLRVERRATRRDWLVVSLPETADQAAARDGIVARPPGSGIGDRAWLLTQVIAAVPLGEWVSRFGLDPAQIVSMPVAGGLGIDVRAGWRQAAIHQASQVWAEAILDAGEPGPVMDRPAAAWPPDDQLAAILPAGARAVRAATLLTGEAPAADAVADAVAEVVRCPGPWTDALADAVMGALSRGAASAGRHYWLAQLATAAARHLPVTNRDGGTDYAAALERLASHDTCPSHLAEALRGAAEAIALRRAFLKEIR